MKHGIKRQRGAVLIVALLFLVILTMLGVTAMTSTTFEERMAGNARDAALAYQAAEAGLREARIDFLGPTYGGERTLHESMFHGEPVAGDVGYCELGLCRPREHGTTSDTVLPDVPENLSWSDTSTAKLSDFTTSGPMVGVSEPPRYAIELFCMVLDGVPYDPKNRCKLYRFTARGWGKNPNTQVTLQEIYFKETL